MAKTPHTIELVGLTLDNEQAKFGKDVVKFCNTTRTITVRNITDLIAELCTNKDNYILNKAFPNNRYTGTCGKDNTHVHFVKKQIVAKLIYWA